MLTAVILALGAILLTGAAYALEQARQWRRIANRPQHEMWSSFERGLAMAAAGSDVRYAWIAIGLAWTALVVEAIRWAA